MNQYISATQAKNLIEANIQLTDSVEVSLLEALGMYSAEHIVAPMEVPSFDNSAMDGYGIRFLDLEKFDELKIVGEVPAGVNPQIELSTGECVRIFTGAKIPKGVDTIVVQEIVEREGDIIKFDRFKVKHKDNIRRRGSQTKVGEVILPEHTLINHAVIGFLAGFGIKKIKVFSAPKIDLLYTGDELRELGEPLEEGQIYNSNSYMLQSALSEIGLKFRNIEHIKDDENSTFEAVNKSLQNVDILILTGGISVGDYDFVKSSLEKAGVEEVFYKINQKPGKPVYFGRRGKQFVFALPGNPASVFSCYHNYVKPFILGCYGRVNFIKEQGFSIITNDIMKKNESQTQFLKGYLDRGKVLVSGSQESYKMDSLVVANCMIEFPAGKTEIKSGEKVKIWKI